MHSTFSDSLAFLALKASSPDLRHFLSAKVLPCDPARAMLVLDLDSGVLSIVTQACRPWLNILPAVV